MRLLHIPLQKNVPFMRKTSLFLSAFTLTLLTTITACKKEAEKTTAEDSTELTTHTDDQSQVYVETDAVANDAGLAVETTSGMSGSIYNLPAEICDATLMYDTAGNTKKITITYNGAACGGTHTRTGSVVLSMPAGIRWKNAGAELTLTFQDLKIKRLRDNKSITLNGTHVITNVSGGLLRDLATRENITHTISSSNMSITFDDGTKRTWQVARKRVFTYNDGVVITVTGNHTEGQNTGIAAWGTNRFGHAFTTSITQPLVIKQNCNFRLTSGEVKHEGFATATATYGLDATGNPTACPGTGAYYCKVVWIGPAGKSHDAIFAY